MANARDHDSRTVEEYDPTLQHSSVQPTLNFRIEIQQSQEQGATEENLLDDDVDWDAVFSITSTIPKDDSLVDARKLEKIRKEAAENGGMGEPSIKPPADLTQKRQLSPFRKHSFPGKVRDRPSALGFSSRALLRVCFRVKELVHATFRCHSRDQELIIEIYARVTYSSRDPLVKRQCFQFRDLSKDKQSFPSGTLSGWRPGSLVDRQSLRLMGNRTPQLCWILSKTRLDSKGFVGLALDVINVRETNWDQIRLAKATTCGE